MKDEVATQFEAIIAPFAVIARGTCMYPDDCIIEESYEGKCLVMTVVPHGADYALFCGPKGRMASSWQYLVRRAGERVEKSTDFRLIEGHVGDREHRDFKPNPRLQMRPIENAIRAVARLVFFNTYEISLEHIGTHAIKVAVRCHPDDHQALFALDDIVWPYGIANGVKLKVRKETGR